MSQRSSSFGTAHAHRYAIVTGVSEGGIGYFVVKLLASSPMNYIVTLGCRNAEKAQQAIHALTRTPQPDGSEPVALDRLRFQKLDIASLASVKQFAEAYKATQLPLHLLINNAAVFGSAQPTPDGLETAMAASHVGPHYLISLLRGLLLASAPARVVNVNSSGHAMGKLDADLSTVLYRARGGMMAGYPDAKLYQMLDGRQWHEQLRGQGVDVVNAHPGSVKTNFMTNMNLEGGAVWPKPVQWLFTWVFMPLFFVSPVEGASAIVSAATEVPAAVRSSAPYTVPAKGGDGRYHAKVTPSGKAGQDDVAGHEIFEMTNRIIQEKTAAFQ